MENSTEKSSLSEYKFFSSTEKEVPWVYQSLGQKINLAEAIISIQLLHKYILKELVDFWDNFISCQVNIITRNLELAKFELEFSNQLKHAKDLESLKKIIFPHNLISPDTDLLKRDIEFHGSNYFMPNLTRGERS